MWTRIGEGICYLGFRWPRLSTERSSELMTWQVSAPASLRILSWRALLSTCERQHGAAHAWVGGPRVLRSWVSAIGKEAEGSPQWNRSSLLRSMGRHGAPGDFCLFERMAFVKDSVYMMPRQKGLRREYQRDSWNILKLAILGLGACFCNRQESVANVIWYGLYHITHSSSYLSTQNLK